MWARALVTVIAILGVVALNWFVTREFDGVTVALFLVFSLLIIAGLATSAYKEPVAAAPPSTSDEI